MRNPIETLKLISPKPRHFFRFVLFVFQHISRKTIFGTFFNDCYSNYVYSRFTVSLSGKKALKLKNLYFPFVDNIPEKQNFLWVSADTFQSYLYYNDQYNAIVYHKLDRRLGEGLCCYQDDTIDVTVKNGDIVFDAGAWIGDFACYAAVEKHAIVYAFEPTSKTYELLKQTASLNHLSLDTFIPVKKGLGDTVESLFISTDKGGANEIKKTNDDHTEKVELTTIDVYCSENNITRVDFIKADIEGYERNMLRGAQHILRTCAPKLSICTYHLPDDPQVLEAIIKEANPDYKIVHTKHKLFAAVPAKTSGK